MKFPEPNSSKTQVRSAGKSLIKGNLPPIEYKEALKIMSNWRACHGYPINTFQANLRGKLKKIHSETIAAQRLKRKKSILKKLRLNTTMNLTTMNDIGGIRAIVKGISEVEQLVGLYVKQRAKHELVD